MLTYILTIESGTKMKKQINEILMKQKVYCAFCGDLAKYDGKTLKGPWGYMCEKCFKLYGVGLGVGKGQILIYNIE